MTLPAPRSSVAGLKALAPDAMAALSGITQAVTASGLAQDLIELVKVRVSQINGCAFCLDFHIKLARQHGVSQAKLDLLSVWPDAPVYDDRERAALAWAEVLTVVADQSVTEDDYAAARAEFSEAELAHLSLAIGTINVWNRLGIAYAFAVPA